MILIKSILKTFKSYSSPLFCMSKYIPDSLEYRIKCQKVFRGKCRWLSISFPEWEEASA